MFFQKKKAPEHALSNIAPIPKIDPNADLTLFRFSERSIVEKSLEALLPKNASITIYSSLDLVDNAVYGGRLIAIQRADHRLTIEAAPGIRPPEPEITCVALQEGVKLQFRLKGQWTGGSSQSPWTMDCAWPAEIIRLQRRRHARIEVPLGRPNKAEFEHDNHRYIANVDDLSLGGVCLRLPKAQAGLLVIGTRLHATIEVGEETPIIAAIEIRDRRSYCSFLFGEQVLLGCGIVDIESACQVRLERMITKLVEAH